ncbi:hypothetical protein N9D02_06240 [Emcibacteraceae bacterium]|nr:hypothetical protein [Emcibacteraceae bacterium]
MTRLITIVATVLLMISSATAADVDGNWNVMFSSAEGGVMVPMEIKVDGENVTAMADGDELTGTYKDGELKLKGPMYVPEAGMSATLDMTAKLEGEDLVGKATWDMYVASVLGTRTE